MTTSSAVDLPPEAPSGSRRGLRIPERFPLARLAGRRYVQPVIVTAGIVGLAVAYYLQARTVGASSEGGSQALQAWEMLHGNVLLSGWSLSDVSFYTTEIPEYALIELVRGLNTWTIPLAGAISYFLQVVLAGLLAKGRATGREGWVRALIAVGIMLAPPHGAATWLLMAGPDHAGTHVPLLLVFLVLDRVRPRWWLPIVIMVMLIWGTVGDSLVFYEGAVPIAAVCLMRVYRRREPWKVQLHDLSLVVAAVASAGVARLILKIIEDSGGFYVRSPIAAFGTTDQVSALFWTKLGNLLLVYGADFFGVTFGPTAMAALIHLIGVVLVFWALGTVIRRFYVEDDQIVQMLTMAFAVVLVAYLLGVEPGSNEIVGLLPIGAVVAGRVLGGRVVKARLVPVLAVVFVTFAVLLGANAAWPPQVNGNYQVAVWLEQHGYTYGLGGYWNAGAVTVETGDRVQVRPVRTYQASVVTTNFQTNASWYDPRQHYANFVIWTPDAEPCGDICLTRSGLTSTFGNPVRVVNVSTFQVLIYNRNLLQSVPEVAWCGNAWPWTADFTPTTNLHCAGISSSSFVPR